MVKSKNRDKRLAALGEELASGLAEAPALAALASQSDGSLFMVDSAGGGRSGRGGKGVKRPRPSEGSAPPAPTGVSTPALIAGALALAAASKVKYLRLDAEEDAPRPVRAVPRDKQPAPPAPRPPKAHKLPPAPVPLTDIWGAAAAAGSAILPMPQLPRPDPAARKVFRGEQRLLSQPPPGGTSYNPRLEDHQAALAHALAAELAEAASAAARRANTLQLPPKEAPKKLSKRALAAQQAQLAAKKAASKALTGVQAHNNFALLDDGAEGGEEEEEEAEEAEEDEEMEDDEEEGDESAAPSASSAAAPPVSKKEARALAKKAARRQAELRKRAARVLDKASGVERAVAAVAAEAAGATNKTAAARAAALAAAAARAAARPAPVLALALSSELTGSLRGMRPISASSLLVPAMEQLVARGEAGRRSVMPRVALVHEGGGEGGAPPTIRVNSDSYIRHAKAGPRKNKRLIEFPRNKNFAPAEAAVRDAIAQGQITGQVLGLQPDFKAQEAANRKFSAGAM